MRPARPVLAGLACAGFLAFLPGFLALAPNRLATGAPVNLFACAPIWGGAIAAVLALQLWAAFRPRAWLALACACASILLVTQAAGAGAAALMEHAGHAARAGFASGFWCLLAGATLSALDAAAALRLSPLRRLAIASALIASVAVLAVSGRFAALSLAQEYAVHRAAFAAATVRHLELVALTLAGAAAIGVPLGLIAWRTPRWRTALFGGLNIIQTLPSIALFGLLMAPLARAGLSGIGVVPAVIALVLYALLPTARAVATGLAGVAAPPLEAAAGLGMAQSQVFWRVRLPLAAPALLAGLRIVLVQTVGLAVVAALIGAGGYGDFVFQGLGQYAVDLVLLGALPATFLALAADGVLTLVVARTEGFAA